jgi:hypothetical protein
MRLNFNLDDVATTEFAVGRDTTRGEIYSSIPVDGDVQTALQEMAKATWREMTSGDSEAVRYQPAEKHDSTGHIVLKLGSDLARKLRDLHEAVNLLPDAGALEEPSAVFCYLARMTDSKLRRLTAVRRASQFKGILKSQLIRFWDDTLTIVDDPVFRLDSDFDFLIDSENIHILHPAGFEAVGELQGAILAAAAGNSVELQKQLPFVDFENIAEYASTHPRAARYVASIRAEGEAEDIDKAALRELCAANGIVLRAAHGKLAVPDKDMLGFLEVLDRRFYILRLRRGQPERFKAGSRRKLE